MIVLHHALADGVGGLAVLAELIDGPSHPPEVCFPGPHRPQPASPATRSRPGWGRCATPRSPDICCASRRPDGGPPLGNMVSPMLVSVPATGGVPDRLRQVAAQVRARKEAATGPPPIALLGWLFRPLAALGAFRWYMDHQHRCHTLVSHVRGPAEPVTFGGCPITAAIPAGVGPGGNIPVYFEVLSSAGTLTVTAIADPDHVPDLATLTDALRAELDVIADRPRHGAENDPPITQHRSEHAGTGRRRDPRWSSAADGPNVPRPHIADRRE